MTNGFRAKCASGRSTMFIVLMAAWLSSIGCRATPAPNSGFLRDHLRFLGQAVRSDPDEPQGNEDQREPQF